MIRHGLGYRRDPILRPLHHIQTRDALLDLSDPTKPGEAEWPDAEFIVGNPPFLGGSLLRSNLGDTYTESLWQVFDGLLPRTSDLCCYFHEKARAGIESGRTRRAGLLATQGIRGQQNRRVLERMNDSGAIFFARADEPWILSGAAVHISFVAQDDGSEAGSELDGRQVPHINANLTVGIDMTKARRLRENAGVAFEGDKKGGPFDIDSETARGLLEAPNPDGRSNVDVVRRWINSSDVQGRSRDMWIIDFGVGMPAAEAALYEAPFEYVRAHVRPERMKNNRPSYVRTWWQHVEPRPGMREALAGVSRFIATTRHSKFRLFTWQDPTGLPDSALAVIARDDDYTFGVLHSRAHDLWARATGTQVREVESGFRYTPTTTFETFPFPRPTNEQREAIGEAARRLVELRDGWLNPADLDPAQLEKRTLTNLYNQRPTWLEQAHAALDAAVFVAYGWPADISDSEILERLLALNLERAANAPTRLA
jgi:type II restriction/modification system DNA methylase subunit YeeA